MAARYVISDSLGRVVLVVDSEDSGSISGAIEALFRSYQDCSSYPWKNKRDMVVRIQEV